MVSLDPLYRVNSKTFNVFLTYRQTQEDGLNDSFITKW